jgi:hypothetical protein
MVARFYRVVGLKMVQWMVQYPSLEATLEGTAVSSSRRQVNLKACADPGGTCQ